MRSASGRPQLAGSCVEFGVTSAPRALRPLTSPRVGRRGSVASGTSHNGWYRNRGPPDSCTVHTMSCAWMALSPRLAAVVDALPLRPGMRVLEIGCGPGAAARAISRRIEPGHVLGIDRSARAIEQARRACAAQMRAGLLSLRQVAVEDLELAPGEAKFDLAFAVRVGALDGRHPELERRAHERIARILEPSGQFFVDGGRPLREVELLRGSG